MTPDDFSSVNLDLLRQNRQWQAQYRQLMEWGNLIQPKPELRLADNKIRGCAADAWLSFDGKRFFFDSDSRIINGLSVLFLSQVERALQQGNSLEGVIDELAWAEMLTELGLQKHLSPSRSNGFRALVRRAHELTDLKKSHP